MGIAQPWWIYFLIFLSAFVTDSIPVVAPPAWAILTFLLLKLHLPLWAVLLAGVPVRTLARYLQSFYMPKASVRFLRGKKHEELKFLSKKLTQRGWQRWIFVFFYSLTPLPATVLFTAAGMTKKVNLLHTCLPFFCGKFVGDAVLILIVQYTVRDFRGLRNGISSAGVLTGILGFAVVILVLLLDWRTLLERKRLHFNFRFWKRA